MELMENLDVPPSYRYAFDSEGFYCGIVKAQRHPLKEGEFLTPANACCVKPTFVEGFRPRWDGSAWGLEPTHLKKKVSSVVSESVLLERRDEMFEHLRTSLNDLLVNEIRSRIDERMEEAFPAFSKLVTDSSRSFLNLVKDEKISTDTRFKNLEDVFFNRIQQMVNELDSKKQEITSMLETLQSLSSKIEVQSVKQKTLFGKFVDYFKAKEPALIVPDSSQSEKSE